MSLGINTEPKLKFAIGHYSELRTVLIADSRLSISRLQSNTDNEPQDVLHSSPGYPPLASRFDSEGNEKDSGTPRLPDYCAPEISTDRHISYTSNSPCRQFLRSCKEAVLSLILPQHKSPASPRTPATEQYPLVTPTTPHRRPDIINLKKSFHRQYPKISKETVSMPSNAELYLRRVDESRREHQVYEMSLHTIEELENNYITPELDTTRIAVELDDTHITAELDSSFTPEHENTGRSRHIINQTPMGVGVGHSYDMQRTYGMYEMDEGSQLCSYERQQLSHTFEMGNKATYSQHNGIHFPHTQSTQSLPRNGLSKPPVPHINTAIPSHHTRPPPYSGTSSNSSSTRWYYNSASSTLPPYGSESANIDTPASSLNSFHNHNPQSANGHIDSALPTPSAYYTYTGLRSSHDQASPESEPSPGSQNHAYTCRYCGYLFKSNERDLKGNS
ncbi:uncharacterized protein K452DRAFT_347032 [Aplosporella prunicola CBS 121167]|uniref:Uncharacterized protein n=1 Tax=Aplosporella prunicola CBS 121167 TaxID=1176127 RepID=A0A6A6BGD1_9PEZI|nr:uncharacterized protein K452DRAFT_347032 [Aplosporella prunicola CBS 121167]KAF2143232.1 hypothetical protein K452DRAFT_347032 [Aplosporella prunicola CBS 121167]